MDYTNWYAVTVATNKENAVIAQLLSRKHVLLDTYLKEVTFLQRKELSVDKAGKRKVTNKKLMPGYVLVRVTKESIENEDGTTTKKFPATTFDLITQTNGVQGFINCDKKHPIAMRPREIKKLFDLCDEAHLETKQNVEADFNVGDILEVVAGPFKGYDVEVMTIQGDKILGQLDMFGRTVPAEFTKFQLYKHD
tara:strand:- start:33 stop:614 length:582 start_codon:yes stop_codon:yes gene_type:complete